jgi:hypothetical protein
MTPDTQNKSDLIISYMLLRKIIGILGTAFPFLLIFGALIIFRTGLQSSISSYYYTGMGDVFVGILCVIGFFLLSYRGYEPIDKLMGDLACIFAVGVALFPTAPDNYVSGSAPIIGYIHLTFAVLFFITLIIFSIFLFTKTKPDQEPTRKKRHRNRIYRICGYIMSVCIVLMILYTVLPDSVVSPVKACNPIFWLEAVAVVSFGISWLVKGEALLKDTA